MKRISIIVAIMIVVFGGAVMLSRGQRPAVQTETFAAVSKNVATGAKLYDVRTPEEYASGHFPGATNWSLQDMQAGKLPNVAKDTQVYVYCHSGNRSSQAAAILQQAGYTHVTDLHGLSSVESIGGTLTTN